MNNTLSICKRELLSYFNSAIAYIVIVIFLLIAGWFFASGLFLENQADLRNVFIIIPLIFMFFIPAITMRLLAEERKVGTLEILVTMPVNDWEIVLGKFFASLLLLISAILLTFTYAITISFLGKVDYGALLSGYIGLIMLGATYISIGIFASSLTSNQIISFIISFAVIFLLFILDKILVLIPGQIAGIFEYLSTDYHLNNIIRGVIDTRDVIYYLSIITFSLFLAVRTMESRKWR